jgi:fatty-acyl-CoA synthase
MEVALTPLEFARRARALYPDREAVIEQEVAVVGMPHEKWGEAPHAHVVLRRGETVTEAELQQFAREHLAHFKVPRWISFVAELPKTATGKVQKYVLRGGRGAIVRQ